MKRALVVIVLVTLIPLIVFSSLIHTAEDGVIRGTIKSYRDGVLTFQLAAARVDVDLDIAKVLKISFDEKTIRGQGLVMKNGLNIPYTILVSIEDGKAIFALPFGMMYVDSLEKLAFLNTQDFTELSLPEEKDFLVETVTEAKFEAALEKAEGDGYHFASPYGTLIVPASHITKMMIGQGPYNESGITLPGNVVIDGAIHSFDGKYHTLKTDFGEIKVLAGALNSWVNEAPGDPIEAESFLIFKNLQQVTGSVRNWSSGTVEYATPWGALQIPQNEIAQIIMGKSIGLQITTTPSGADVSFDGEPTGKSPVLISTLTEGKHTLVVSMPGYRTVEREVYTTPMMYSQIEVVLEYGNFWETKTPMPTARSSHGAVVCDGRIYAIGGFDGNSRLNRVEAYDPATDGWTEVAPMPTARSSIAAVLCQDRIYVIGGHDGSKRLSKVEAYDPASNAWTTVSPMETARNSLTAVAYEERIYVIGGFDGSKSQSRVDVYDPRTDKWSSAAPMPTARYGLAAVVYGGRIYAMGGNDGSVRLDRVEVYDPATDGWTEVAPMPTAREWLTAVVYGERIYAIGGYSGSVSNRVEVYDPANDSWIEAVPMSAGREWFAAVVSEDWIYAVGGSDGKNHLNRVEAYNPAGIPPVASSTEVADDLADRAEFDLRLVVVAPITADFYLGESHDLEIELVGPTNFKESFENVASGDPNTVTIASLKAGTYEIRTKWGDASRTWTVELNDGESTVRFMM